MKHWFPTDDTVEKCYYILPAHYSNFKINICSISQGRRTRLGNILNLDKAGRAMHVAMVSCESNDQEEQEEQENYKRKESKMIVGEQEVANHVHMIN